MFGRDDGGLGRGSWAWRIQPRGAGLRHVRTEEALAAHLAGVDRPSATEPASDLVREATRRADGAMLAYIFGDAAIPAAIRLARDDEGSREVLACFIQERVMAGADLARFDDVRTFWDRARGRGELGALPLALLPVERGALLTPPHTESDSGGWSFRCGLYGQPAPNAPPTTALRASAVREATPEEAAAIGAIMGHPRLFPNATFEAHVVTLPEPLGLGHASVAGLSLPCFEDAVPGTFVEEAVDAREVFGRFLSVATWGGCYGKGRSAAYGRLYAWRSLAGLLGLPWGTPLEAIAEEAERASFTWFRLESAWYVNVSIDIGVACLRKDRRTLVVLAGTDCD